MAENTKFSPYVVDCMAPSQQILKKDQTYLCCLTKSPSVPASAKSVNIKSNLVKTGEQRRIPCHMRVASQPLMSGASSQGGTPLLCPNHPQQNLSTLRAT